jgi:transcriptional regulator with XRE-family HTH domain
MEATGTSLEQLVEASGLDSKLVRAIAAGNYTPSPQERQRLAAALGVSVDDIAWGHAVPVDHMWGHGPQFGRTP